MAIDVLHDSAIKAMPENVYGIRKAAPATQAVAKEQNSVVRESADNVSFTSAAKDLSLASQIARESDGINYARVAELKEQIENGTYVVDAASTAAHIMAAEAEVPYIFA